MGLLVAPASGAQSRRYLASKTSGGRKFLSTSGRDFLDKTRELYAKGCELADEAAEMFDEGRKLVRG